MSPSNLMNAMRNSNTPFVAIFEALPVHNLTEIRGLVAARTGIPAELLSVRIDEGVWGEEIVVWSVDRRELRKLELSGAKKTGGNSVGVIDLKELTA